MIPLETWLTSYAQRQPYLKTCYLDTPGTDPHEVLNLGPSALGVTGEPHLVREWYVSVDGAGVVKIYGAVGNVWEHVEDVFTLVGVTQDQIVKLDWDFDQNSSPVIFFEVEGNQIWGWFPNLSGIFEFQRVGDGSHISVTFDYPEDPSDGDSDLILFYKSLDNRMTYAYQRDRYIVERHVGIQGEELVVGKSGVTTHRRVQIEYSGVDILPPETPGTCQPISTTPNQTYTAEYISALIELPTGKILVGRTSTTSQTFGEVGIADNLQAVEDGLISSLIPTYGIGDFAVIFNDTTKTIVVASTRVDTPTSEILPSDMIILEISSIDDTITEIRVDNLLGIDSVNLSGIAIGGTWMYYLVYALGEPSIMAYLIDSAEDVTFTSSILLIDDIKRITEDFSTGDAMSLAYRNRALFLTNHNNGNTYQVDILTKDSKCSFTLQPSNGTKAGANISFNQNQNELWSIQDTTPTVQIEIYPIGA